MFRILILTSILLFLSIDNYCVVRNVPGNYPTIQSAINASNDGDTVLVETGTYFENINFRGKNIVLTSRYYISNDLSYITNTIINGSQPLHADTASCVIISSGEDSSAVLQGFTLTAGTGTKWQDIHGAGRYTEGGGILIELSEPTIQFNIIRNNFAENVTGLNGAGGGGIRIGDGNPKIINNVITYNKGLYGAGVVLNYTGVILKNNVISNNFGSYTFGSGSAIWCYSNLGTFPKIIENNTIVFNSATTSGTGGIYIASASNVIIRNNIIWGNNSNVSQLQIQGGASSSINYNNIMGGWSTGTGNINITPGFSDTNYILSVSSQCIDKGDSSFIYNDPGTGNIAEYPSRGTVRNDLGAYGGPGRKLLSNSLIGIKKPSSIVKGFVLNQNYPNPFNPVTVISFELPVNSNVSLKVYDNSGKLIETIFNKQQTAGSVNVNFDGSKYSSGVYFYQLSVYGSNTLLYSETKKMILIK